MSELRQINNRPTFSHLVPDSRGIAESLSAQFFSGLTTNLARTFLLNVLTAALVFGLSTLTVSMANENFSAQDPALFEERVYIVQLEQPPALSYRGKPGGLAATRPVNGRRFNPRSSDVRQYSRQLIDTHDDLLQSVGAHDGKLYSYRYTFNGFAARLTPIQAQKLRSKKNVLNVWEDQVRYLSTNDSPVFLGLFDSQGGLVTDRGLKGENVVIGVIDSGISPEHRELRRTVQEASRPRLCRSTWAETSLLGLWLCRRFDAAR